MCKAYSVARRANQLARCSENAKALAPVVLKNPPRVRGIFCRAWRTICRGGIGAFLQGIEVRFCRGIAVLNTSPITLGTAPQKYDVLTNVRVPLT